MSDIRIVYSKPLAAWYVVRGAALTPITGAFTSKEQAQAWMNKPKPFGKAYCRYIPAGYTLYKSGGDVMVYASEVKGWVYGKCFIGKALKPSWTYAFKGWEKLDGYIAQTMLSREAAAARKKAAQAERSKPTSVKVGDVFQATWGYEQTNIDYYQVTRLVGRQSVEVREIKALSVETGDMRGKCAPAIGDFKGEPMIKRLQNYSGTATIKIASYANAYLLAPVGMIGDVPVYRPANWTAYA